MIGLNRRASTKVSRLVLNLRHGICMTEKSGSRYNLRNLAQVLVLIEKLVAHNVFAPWEIAIQSPYREQNNRYYQAFAKASSTSFWTAGRNIWDVTMMTIDTWSASTTRSGAEFLTGQKQSCQHVGILHALSIH